MWTNATLNDSTQNPPLTNCINVEKYDIRTNILVRPNTTSSNAKDMIEFASYHFVLDEKNI
jgi:hypothetical protein